MSSITLSTNTRTMLQEAEKFLTRDIELLLREDTLLAKVLSWMPIANLVNTHNTLATTERSFTTVADLVKKVNSTSDYTGTQIIYINCNESLPSPISTLTEAKYTFQRREKADKTKARIAKQYFFQTLLVVATVAIAFFGSPLAAGASLLVGAAVLHTTIGLNCWPSKSLGDANTKINIPQAQGYLKNIQNILSLDSSKTEG